MPANRDPMDIVSVRHTQNCLDLDDFVEFFIIKVVDALLEQQIIS